MTTPLVRDFISIRLCALTLKLATCSWNSLGTRLETEAFSCLGKPLTCFSILELPKTSNVTATVKVPIIHTYYIVHISHVVVVHNYLCTRLSLVGSAQCRVLKCTVYCACVLFIKRTALIWLAVESAETPPTAHGMHCILYSSVGSACEYFMIFTFYQGHCLYVNYIQVILICLFQLIYRCKELVLYK